MYAINKAIKQRINRNIVECKCYIGNTFSAVICRINRNIVECKFFHTCYCRFRLRELIETLWNVNPMAFAKCDFINKELIETLWNVNFFDFFEDLRKLLN